MRTFRTIFSAFLVLASGALHAMELLEEYQRDHDELCAALLPPFDDEQGCGSAIDFKKIHAFISKKAPALTVDPINLHLPIQEPNQTLKRPLQEYLQSDESSISSHSFLSVQSCSRNSDSCSSRESSSSKSHKTDEQSSTSTSSKLFIKVEPTTESEPPTNPTRTRERRPSYAHIMHICVFAGCTKIFESPRDFQEHVEAHLQGTPYECIKKGCTQTFQKINDWIHHMHSHMDSITKKKIIRAPMVYPSKAQDYSISVEEIKKLPFDCIKPDCTISNPSLGEWVKHYDSPHKTPKSFPCAHKECNLVFPTVADRNYHMRNHSLEKPYACTWQGCDKRFSRAITLSSHFKEHVPYKYACSTPGCTKVFACSSGFSRHKKICTFQIKAEPQEEEAS